MHLSFFNPLTAATLLGFAALAVAGGQTYRVQLHAGNTQDSFSFSGPDDQSCLLVRIPLIPSVRQTLGAQSLDANSMCCFVNTDDTRSCFWHGIAAQDITAAGCSNIWSGAEKSVDITFDHINPVAQGWGNTIACK